MNPLIEPQTYALHFASLPNPATPPHPSQFTIMLNDLDVTQILRAPSTKEPTASAEYSFSKLVKTVMRSVMNQERLTELLESYNRNTNTMMFRLRRRYFCA